MDVLLSVNHEIYLGLALFVGMMLFSVPLLLAIHPDKNKETIAGMCLVGGMFLSCGLAMVGGFVWCKSMVPIAEMFADVRSEIDLYVDGGGDFETIANAKDIGKIISSLAEKGEGKYIFSIDEANEEDGFVIIAKEKTNRKRTISEAEAKRLSGIGLWVFLRPATVGKE